MFKRLSLLTKPISGGLLMILGMFLAMPQMSHAQACSITKNGNLSDLFLFPACLINEYLIPIAIAIEVVLFTYGIILYIAKADNQEQRKQGSQYIMWGILAIFITLSFWAIIGILQRTLQIG